eukprot:11068932-Alexandrium_andersonii.AAC.1
MPPGLGEGVALPAGSRVPCGRLRAGWDGWAPRVNAGVCVLRPNVHLLDYIVEQIEPSRHL